MPDKSSMSGPHRLLNRLRHFSFLFTRPMTLGAQAIVLDAQNRVFLLRHTYVPGWHLPGGGVETGESASDALARELREEGNIILDGPPVLHGVFFNDQFSKRDHIMVYVVRDFHQSTPRKADFEIAETGFFGLDDLPAATTRAARARIAEVRIGGKPPPKW